MDSSILHSEGKIPSELLDQMKVNDPNLNSLATTGASQTQGTARARSQSVSSGSGGSNVSQSGSGGSGDDIHLSELVRSLRSLAADSPQRQQHLESIARTYATGNYQVNASATAGKIIDDAIKP